MRACFEFISCGCIVAQKARDDTLWKAVVDESSPLIAGCEREVNVPGCSVAYNLRELLAYSKKIERSTWKGIVISEPVCSIFTFKLMALRDVEFSSEFQSESGHYVEMCLSPADCSCGEQQQVRNKNSKWPISLTNELQRTSLVIGRKPNLEWVSWKLKI